MVKQLSAATLIAQEISESLRRLDHGGAYAGLRESLDILTGLLDEIGGQYRVACDRISELELQNSTLQSQAVTKDNLSRFELVELRGGPSVYAIKESEQRAGELDLLFCPSCFDNGQIKALHELDDGDLSCGKCLTAFHMKDVPTRWSLGDDL